RQPLEEQTSAILIRQLAQQEIEIGVRLGHTPILQEQTFVGAALRGRPLLSADEFRGAATECRPYKSSLDVVIQRELEWMRAHAERRDLAIALVSNPALDQLRAEHVTLEQEVVIGFQRFQRIVERTRQS